MSAPPADANASELFVLLSRSARPHRIIELPRKKADGTAIEAAVVPLSQDDMIISAAEAERKARRLLKDDLPKKEDAQLGYADLYNNSAALEVLFRACKKPGELTRSLFANPGELGKLFTNDEIAVLYNNYLTVKQELGPIVATLSDDEFEAWVRLLAEGGSASPLDFCSWGVIQNLVLTMASRLHAFQTGSFSAGSPSEPADLTPPDSTE